MNYKLQITNYKLLAAISGVIFVFFCASPLYAQTLNPSQEARFNRLALEIRCVVCQSEPVATSQAKIAIDMRGVIRQRIAAGESDTEVRQYFADHYGENVLLRPQFNSATIALWATPLLLLATGFVFLLGLFRLNRTPISQTGTAEDADKDEIENALKAIED